jgi:hypothetical protein
MRKQTANQRQNSNYQVKEVRRHDRCTFTFVCCQCSDSQKAKLTFGFKDIVAEIGCKDKAQSAKGIALQEQDFIKKHQTRLLPMLKSTISTSPTWPKGKRNA